MSETRVIVSGCTGRMGNWVVELVNQHPNWKVVGGFGLGKHHYKFPVFGAGASEAKKLFELQKPDIIIDFSSPDTTESLYFDYALKYSIPMVCGTTKLKQDILDNMKMQNCIPVFQAYNFLTSMKIFTRSVCDAAVNLAGYDIDIVESHHAHKADAPSGTAKNLANAINTAIGNTYNIMYNHNFHKPRGNNEICITSIRRGDDPGTHTVTFSSDGELCEFTHKVISKEPFATGAIKAAEFLLNQPAGYYNMDDLI